MDDAMPLGTFAARLRSARERAGFTVHGLAERLPGVSAYQVTRWEHARAVPRGPVRKALADTVGERYIVLFPPREVAFGLTDDEARVLGASKRIAHKGEKFWVERRFPADDLPIQGLVDLWLMEANGTEGRWRLTDPGEEVRLIVRQEL